jgi:hypothetical protein
MDQGDDLVCLLDMDGELTNMHDWSESLGLDLPQYEELQIQYAVGDASLDFTDLPTSVTVLQAPPRLRATRSTLREGASSTRPSAARTS